MLAIYWDPKPEIFTLPFVNWPILWYGVLFAIGFIAGFSLFVSILSRYYGPKRNRAELVKLTDRLTLYMVVATIAGARLGHYFFYENPANYWNDPLEVFRIWEGGLASHGAAVAIILALILLSRRIRPSFPELSWIRLLDFVCVPTAFAGFCIRIGNFFNQEILGTRTDLPWGVVFGHPADRSFPVPRHPVQLYEAFFYLAVFLILWRLTHSPRFLKTEGKLIGLFLITVFGFRFCIEFFKLEQSQLLSLSSSLTMGQILSLPLIGAGLIFFFWGKIRKS